MTWIRRGSCSSPGELRVFVTAIVWTSSSLKPAVEEPIGDQRHAVLDRRVEYLPEIGGQTVFSGPAARMSADTVLPRSPCPCAAW